MHMYYVGLEVAEQSCKLKAGVRRPDGSLRQADFSNTTVLVRFPITPAVERHLVPRAFEQVTLLIENNVFAAGLLIRVVDQ